jgi:sarcosine oxidase subunit gamma
VIGCALPERLCSAVGRDVEAFWLGPDTWLLQADLPAVAGLERSLRAALGAVHHAVVEVSHRFAGIGVDGPRAREVLAAGCLVDLHPRAFPPGAVARTLLGKATVVLVKRHEYRFELLVDGSFAPYAWRFLENAAREHGFRVVG